MLILRNKYLLKIAESLSQNPITVLIGARQVGKTSLLESLKTDFLVLKMDGQAPDIQNLFANIDDIISLIKIRLNEELNGLLIIDEFQLINNISSSLKILVDNNKKLKILCSGSSSLDIIQKVEESLAGRIRIINVYSLSFSESILFEKNKLFSEYQKYDKTTNTAIINSEIKQILNKQLIYGGMPRIGLIKKPKDKIQILDDIYKTYLLKDVKNYVRNIDSVGFNKLLKLLALQIGNLVNINELSRTSGLSYNKCEDYLYLLEQMFIIKLIEPYELNNRKAIKKMKKIYFLDLGIRNIIIQNFNSLDVRADAGALFENFVLLEILKQIETYYSVNFYRTRDGAEVDFIINNMFQKNTVEVKFKQLKKTVFYKALNNFNSNQDINQSYVINLSLNLLENKIHFIPAYLIEKILL